MAIYFGILGVFLKHDQLAKLDHDIEQFMAHGIEYKNDTAFNDLALREFEMQFMNVMPYREYCEQKNKTPDTVSKWQEIPAVPSAAFKSHKLASFPLEKTVQTNITSGTTGRKNRGKVYRDKGSLALIIKANGMMTKEYLFPDIERIKILFLVPSPQIAPGMGMAIGMEEVRKQFGTDESAFLVTRTGLDVKSLLATIKQAEKTGEPLALIGATSALIYFLKECVREQLSFTLPPESRICDGGGYMGQFGECTKEEYFQLCSSVFGVDPEYCINVLGTAESSTNYFDNVLRNSRKYKETERYKEIPPWTRTMAVDPETLVPIEDGVIGLLRHYDLTNRAMIFGVQTDNLGMTHEGGFEIIGRWNREHGAYVLGYSGGMPSGKLFNKITDYLMTRKMVGLRKICQELENVHG